MKCRLPGNEKILPPFEETFPPTRVSTTWSWVGQAMGFPAIPCLTWLFIAFPRKLYASSHVRLHLGKQKFLLAALSGGLFVWPANFATLRIRIYLRDTFCRICADCNRWSVNVQILPEIFQPSSTAVAPENKTCSGHYQRTTAIPVQWQHKRYKSILQIALGYFSAVPVQPKLLRLVLFLLPAAAVLFFFTICVGLSGECQVIKWSPKLEAIYEVQRKKSKGSYCSKTC